MLDELNASLALIIDQTKINAPILAMMCLILWGFFTDVTR